MTILTKILSILVALEFIYIFYLETIITTSSITGKVFKMSKEELENKNVQLLFKNQGIYNLLISVLIIIATYIFVSTIWLKLILIYIILVAIYGGITSDKSIILKQAGIAIITLITLFI